MQSFDTLSLDDQIDLAEWNLTLAQSHLDDLKRQKAKYDAHIEAEYQRHVDLEFGKAACEADAAECNECKSAEVLHVS